MYVKFKFKNQIRFIKQTSEILSMKKDIQKTKFKINS